MSLHRFNTRTDANQLNIVNGLKKLGYSVIDLKRVGGGAPDIIVAKREEVYFFEIKTEKGKLNEKQIAFRAFWNGPNIETIRSIDEALDYIRRQSIDRRSKKYIKQ